MRRFLLSIVVLLLLSVPSLAQRGNTVIREFAAAPTGPCVFIMLAIDASTGDLYACDSGTWLKIGPGAGGGGLTHTINGSALASSTAIDFDDALPVAPANSININWAKDALDPTNVSASILMTEITQTGTITAGTWNGTAVAIGFGGTNAASFTGNRCVRVNAGGTAFEAAPADCNSGGSAHNILSATHSDTTAASVVRGDLMTGQTATPEWTRLAIGGANDIFGTDGTDAAWEAATGTTSPVRANNPLFPDRVRFTAIAAPAHSAGQFFYDSGNESVTFHNNEAEVALQIGQETWIRVRNESGSTISNGQVVYIDGSASGFPRIALARADASTTAEAVGLATHDIETASTGFVTAYGMVRDFDTSAFALADRVFLSASTAGAITNTAPSDPNFVVSIGIVTEVNVSTGDVLVTLGAPRFTGGSGILLDGSTISTLSSEEAFLVSGALSCGMNTAGKMQTHTTPLQYCDNAATPTLQLAAYGASDGDALAGDDATSFFDTGTIEATRLPSAAAATLGVIELDNALAGSASAVELASGVAGFGLVLNTATTPDSLDVDLTANYAWTGQHDFDTAEIMSAIPIRFEGFTDDNVYSTITVTDPTVGRTFTLPNADSNSVQPLTCTGDDKVSAISSLGVVTCSTDQVVGSANWETLTNSADTATLYTADNNAETFTINTTSNWGTDRFTVSQGAGNPTAGSLATISYTDTDIDALTINDGTDTLVVNSGDMGMLALFPTGGAEIHATEVLINVEKGSAGTITAGQVVYQSGFDAVALVIEVELADADSSTTMPAIGVAQQTITDTVPGHIAAFGTLSGIDTSAFSVGDDLYVSGTAGDLTATKPTGTALIQKVAQVGRSHVSLGVIEVFGAGRTNDLPNIANDNIWIGDSSGVPVASIIVDCQDTGGNHLNYTQSTNAFACGTSVLSTTVLTDQSNTYSTGDQSFAAAGSLTVPTAAGAAPTSSGDIRYDSTSFTLEYGDNGTNRVVANLNEAQTFSTKTLDSSNVIQAGAYDTASVVLTTDVSGLLPNDNGGTGIDSSGFTGVARVDSGTWTVSELSGDVATSGSNATLIQAGVVASAELATANKTFKCNFVLFDENGLSDTDDIPTVSNCSIPGRAITINEVRCEYTTGTAPTVQLQKDDGAVTNMLSATLTCGTDVQGTCGTGCTTSFVSTENQMAAEDNLDFLLLTANTSTRISMVITGTVD